jgi:hypothetical protein
MDAVQLLVLSLTDVRGKSDKFIPRNPSPWRLFFGKITGSSETLNITHSDDSSAISLY